MQAGLPDWSAHALRPDGSGKMGFYRSFILNSGKQVCSIASTRVADRCIFITNMGINYIGVIRFTEPKPTTGLICILIFLIHSL